MKRWMYISVTDEPYEISTSVFRARYLPEAVNLGALRDDGKKIVAWTVAEIRDEPVSTPSLWQRLFGGPVAHGHDWSKWVRKFEVGPAWDISWQERQCHVCGLTDKFDLNLSESHIIPMCEGAD